MRNVLGTGIAIIFFLPLCAYAQGINNITISSSQSGGSVSSSNATVTGSSSASAVVRNVIGTVGTTSRVEVEVKTERDGVIRVESVKKNIEVQSASVEIAASANVQKADVPQEEKSRSEKSFFTLEPFRAILKSFFGFLGFF